MYYSFYAYECESPNNAGKGKQNRSSSTSTNHAGILLQKHSASKVLTVRGDNGNCVGLVKIVLFYLDICIILYTELVKEVIV